MSYPNELGSIFSKGKVLIKSVSPLSQFTHKEVQSYDILRFVLRVRGMYRMHIS